MTTAALLFWLLLLSILFDLLLLLLVVVVVVVGLAVLVVVDVIPYLCLYRRFSYFLSAWICYFCLFDALVAVLYDDSRFRCITYAVTVLFLLVLQQTTHGTREIIVKMDETTNANRCVLYCIVS